MARNLKISDVRVWQDAYNMRDKGRANFAHQGKFRRPKQMTVRLWLTVLSKRTVLSKVEVQTASVIR